MAKDNKTVINKEFANQPTEINSSVNTSNQSTSVNPAVNNGTVINSAAQSVDNMFTEMNPAVQNYSINVPQGTVLANQYKVTTPLQVNSGEANLYLCENNGIQYVAKIYRRQSAVKDSIVSALSNINSPYVAKTYVTGVWNNAPFEILPYYKYGSLEGKTFSFAQLKGSVIPALNEGIHALHMKGVIHKDLKPSNIMLCDDQKSVSIIDFGISSVREGGNTVVVTRTGMTPEYSAPETFRSLFLEESDYYSLGITLYELFCGHTPYAGTDKEMIEQYIAIQKIPFPKDFPNDLRDLITALTYNDITNRKDKNNPNRRWTYEEVKRWCAGEKLPLPGGISATAQQPIVDAEEDSIPLITFQYNRYKSRLEFANALGADWENGKKRLYRSALTTYFERFDSETMVYCKDAEEAANKTPSRRDIEYFGVLYHICPYMEPIYWKGLRYDSIQTLGQGLLGRLQNNTEIPDNLKEMLTSHLFSLWESIRYPKDTNISKNIYNIETKYILARQANDMLSELEALYTIAYYYSHSNVLQIPAGTFSTIDELVIYAKNAIKNSPKTFDTLAQQLLIKTGNESVSPARKASCRPTPQFSAWLNVLGKSNVLNQLGFNKKEESRK